MTKPRKILFLDVDGVLNNIVSLSRGIHIDPHCVVLLDRVLEEVPDVDIVISSVWRANGVDKMEFLLESTGLQNSKRIEIEPGAEEGDLRKMKFHSRIVGTTGKWDDCRGREIQNWLDAHPEVERFVIVDDDSDMLENQLPFFVQTEGSVGLTSYDVEKIIELLRAE